MDLDRDRDFVPFSSCPLKVNFERKNNYALGDCDKGFCRTGMQNVHRYSIFDTFAGFD